MAKKRARKSAENKAEKRTLGMPIAILSLILNILIPGVGSLVAGRINSGIWQLVVLAFGVLIITMFYSLYFVGLLVIAIAFVWGIYTSIVVIKNAQ